MNKLDLYLKFRQELDKICVPEILKMVQTTEIKYGDKVAGILCTNPDYIDCLYILPEYRRKGIGRKAVLEWWQQNHRPDVRLHIINNNRPALRFWKSIFVLKRIGGNEIDTLYEIVKMKGDF
jgi:ribosomal protein S18 acetylase RimI-like enzyme